MSQNIVVGYDDSVGARAALKFAVKQAKAQGGSVVVAHVLEWSPYSFLTPTELEERHARRKDELARAEAALLQPAVETARESGVEVSTDMRYGHTAETLLKIALEAGAGQIVIGRTGNSELSARLFGSVAGTLAQASTVPVTIVP